MQQPVADGAGEDPLAVLRSFDAERRAATDFAKLPASDQVTGPDPYRIRAAPGAAGFVGILRGRDAVVSLDERLEEKSRLAAPGSPSGLAVGRDGAVWVVGEDSSLVSRYRLNAGALSADGAIDLGDVRAMRDVATGPEGVVYVVEEHDDRLLWLHPERAGADGRIAARRGELRLDAGPVSVARVGPWLLVDCLLQHTLVALPVDGAGAPVASGLVRVEHQGPIWGVSAVEAPGGLWIAAGGVEDHPLDRRGGSFGFVDSFAWLLWLDRAGARRVAEANVSELGVVTPKALDLELVDGQPRVLVTGYGGDRAVTLAWEGSTPEQISAKRDGSDPSTPPRASTLDLPPGTSSLVRVGARRVAANPLLDRWVSFDDTGAWASASVADPGRTRDADARLGEILFFTTRMAPNNSSRDELSRFTCETCHFEGYVDGRTHHTGRGDIRATTKPLLGLFNNRPHFTRALDPDLVAVSHNEFAVAGKRSGLDPWFSLRDADAPWLRLLAEGGAFRERSPLDLRRSLMAFLMEFTHRPNPRAVGRKSWSDAERAGAELFRQRCESCHASRLASDDPGSVVPFERWESLVLSREGPIVWGRIGYEKTGIQPYVHADGARVPSLRRLYKKRPYFTNGSARSPADVVAAVRFGGARFSHAAEDSPGAQPLSDTERTALLAFLDLL